MQPNLHPGGQPALLDEDEFPAFVPPELVGYPDDELFPLDWNTLTAEEAEAEWLDLNRWVHWLRGTYGLPATVLAPLWHRHDEMVWELSALHPYWRASYRRDAAPTAPAAWHRDFEDTQRRLRQMVAACGTRMDRDHATRQTVWPGEPPIPAAVERVITNREEDFAQFVLDEVHRRRERERLPA
jgi:hypothetical protein